ncbi:MAG: endonuclease/exonuclease/phosphatase family protein [Bryobacterales bacterium]|nr:endonuclease/exonuclease/phosphatase family protein [Bryobacterales bacterium]
MKYLRVATYNVHKCEGMDGRVRPDRIVSVLAEINADVVALQEVLSVPGHRDESDQAAYIARRLGMVQVQAQARRLRGGVYGNVLLTPTPVRLWQNLDITHSGREERSVLRADLQIDGRLLHFFNVHLGTSYFERRHQAGALFEERILHSPDLRGDRILLGDLNEWTRGLVTRRLTGELRRIDLEIPFFRRRTYPALLPLLHLDYIYYEHTLRARDAFFHHSRLALVASDHVPLVADFSL